MQFGGTVNGSANLDSPFDRSVENPLEALLGASFFASSSVKVSGGAGVGLLNGYGVPDARVFVGLMYAQHDADRDGLVDSEDKCPQAPEDKDAFEDADGCPDPDNDGDGVLDVTDACPLAPEDKDAFEDADGCADPDNDADGTLDVSDKCVLQPGPAAYQGCPPPDADRDGLADDVDACPNEPGPAALKGCPDSDGDGLLDSQDACPKAPETMNGVADEDGCPDSVQTKVSLSKERIIILEQVLFDTAKATIKQESFELLDQVAKVFEEHPEIKRVRIEGHTDDVGNDKKNQTLSDNRAKAVMAYLVAKKIDASRLEAVGYGETKPLVANDTPENRQKNRRVVFSIIDPPAPTAP